MGNILEWRKQVEEWTELESKGEKVAAQVNSTPNLTLVALRIPRVCAKCGETEGLIHRHHKGHEFLWAKLLPEKYARRYIEFRDSDIVMLCEKRKCHFKIHKLYEPRLYDLWNLLYLQDGEITYEQAERFRLKLIRCCNNWLKRKVKKRK